MVRFLVLGLNGGGIALMANILTFAMLDQINQKLPKEKQLSWMWYGTLGIRRQHKDIYPDSKLSFLLNVCTASLAMWFLVTIWIWVLGALSDATRF